MSLMIFLNFKQTNKVFLLRREHSGEGENLEALAQALRDGEKL